MKPKQFLFLVLVNFKLVILYVLFKSYLNGDPTTTTKTIINLDNYHSSHQQQQQQQQEKPSFVNYKNPNIKIYCLVLTQIKNLRTKARAVFNTWASKCYNHKFLSTIPHKYLNISLTTTTRTRTNQSNEPYESIEIKFDNLFTILKPEGLVKDTYNKLTDKIFYSIIDIYKQNLNRNDVYDWYYKADDDTFVLMDNLREFLSDKDPNLPVTYGYDFGIIVNGGYHSGGAGYVLSREAFNRLGAQLIKNKTFCKNTGYEDVDVANCLRKLNVNLNKSVDAYGKERFHPLNIDSYFKNGSLPGWIYHYSANPVLKGFNCCSDTSISFHYMPPKQMLKLSTIIDEFKTINFSIIESHYALSPPSSSSSISFRYIVKNLLNITNDNQFI